MASGSPAEGQTFEKFDKQVLQMVGFGTRPYRTCLAETKMLANIILDENLDGAMKQQEWLFRTYIGSEDNHRRIDALREKLKKNEDGIVCKGIEWVDNFSTRA